MVALVPALLHPLPSIFSPISSVCQYCVCLALANYMWYLAEYLVLDKPVDLEKRFTSFQVPKFVFRSL